MDGGSVVVVGQGYVGLPLAMAAVSAGKRVVGVDTNSARVEQIASGVSPVTDVDSTDLAEALGIGRYRIQNDYNDLSPFDVAVITVPTPLDAGKPNLAYIESAAKSVAQSLTPGCLVVLESTTYPGTTQDLLVPILESNSELTAGEDFHVGYSPERIDPGNTEWNLINTPKVTSGIDAGSAEAVADFYSSLGISVVPVSGTREAELTKLLENTFRHVNIALVNELAMFSHQLGVNIWEAIEAASTKPFGFMKFSPGPGVGGHCLPVDPSYLSWAIHEQAGENFKFVELANTINSFMPSFVVQKIQALLAARQKPIEGFTVLIGGLAYKPKTGDVRESPALAVASLLSSQGIRVSALDDYVSPEDWPSFIVPHSADATNYDLGVNITPHDEAMMKKMLHLCDEVLDTRGVMKGPSVVTL